MKLFPLQTLVCTWCVFILCGCVSKYPITFDSYPQGATLIWNGRVLGYTPITVKVECNKNELKNKGFYLNNVIFDDSNNEDGCYAYWISGAITNYTNEAIPIEQYPKGVVLTAMRPNIDGFQQDAEFAVKVQQLKLLEQQAITQQQILNAQRQQAFDQQIEAGNRRFDVDRLQYSVDRLNRNVIRANTQK